MAVTVVAPELETLAKVMVVLPIRVWELLPVLVVAAALAGLIESAPIAKLFVGCAEPLLVSAVIVLVVVP